MKRTVDARRRGRRGQLAAWVMVGGLAITGACSLIVESNTNQCMTDGDCSQFGAYSACQSGICVVPTGHDGGSDGGHDGGHDSGHDGGVDASDSGSDASDASMTDIDAGEDGGGELMCFVGMPVTDPEFLNQCTDAGCIPFDNCARIGLCGEDAGLPVLVPPFDGGLGPPPDAGSGGDAGGTADSGSDGG